MVAVVAADLGDVVLAVVPLEAHVAGARALLAIVGSGGGEKRREEKRREEMRNGRQFQVLSLANSLVSP